MNLSYKEMLVKNLKKKTKQGETQIRDSSTTLHEQAGLFTEQIWAYLLQFLSHIGTTAKLCGTQLALRLTAGNCRVLHFLKRILKSMEAGLRSVSHFPSLFGLLCNHPELNLLSILSIFTSWVLSCVKKSNQARALHDSYPLCKPSDQLSGCELEHLHLHLSSSSLTRSSLFV